VRARGKLVGRGCVAASTGAEQRGGERGRKVALKAMHGGSFVIDK
jgi:hypothetical protein